jgi:hypothetical protein
MAALAGCARPLLTPGGEPCAPRFERMELAEASRRFELLGSTSLARLNAGDGFLDEAKELALRDACRQGAEIVVVTVRRAPHPAGTSTSVMFHFFRKPEAAPPKRGGAKG